MLSLAQENPAQREIEHLLRQSDEHAASLYPPESNHLVDSDALAARNVRFFVARWDSRVVGCGAMVINQNNGSAELKRMFVDPASRGRGVARALTARGIPTARDGEWSDVQVAAILRR